MIKILICDDQEIVREGLRNILESDPELVVVGTAIHGQDALDHLEVVQPDLVLMDLHMPIMSGPEAIRRIRANNKTLPVLVLTTYSEDTWLFDAIRSGATGYILKDRPGAELISIIKEPCKAGITLTRRWQENLSRMWLPITRKRKNLASNSRNAKRKS